MRPSVVFAICLFCATPAYAGLFGNDAPTQTQEQGQGQGQEQGQYQVVNPTSESFATTESYVGEVYAGVEYQQVKPAVSSAPNLYVASCNRGVSGQMYDAGGSLGSKDPVCTFLDLSAAARAAGHDALADELLSRAISEATTRHIFTRLFSWIPLVGFLF